MIQAAGNSHNAVLELLPVHPEMDGSLREIAEYDSVEICCRG